MFSWSTSNYSTCNIGVPGGWVRVQLLVCKCWCVPRPLLWSLHRLWFCRFDSAVYSYNLCVVYCGPELTLGLIPLQMRLPEKLLWWNVRQEKGRWGQTEKLFSLSLCFTFLTSVQNPHLAVIASMREEIREKECENGGVCTLCACLHV